MEIQRVTWVDNAKTILIFLVILGHFLSLNDNVKNIIYSFHIPAFIMITGFLSGQKLKEMSFIQLWHKMIRPYCILYLLFSILAIIILSVVKHGGANWIIIIDSIKGVLYGVHGKELMMVHNNGPLWYFPYLITSLIMSYFLFKINTIGFIISIIGVCLDYIIDDTRLPWCLDVGMSGVFFIMIGTYLKTFLDKHQDFFNNRHYLLNMCIILSLILVVLSSINGSSNLNRSDYGINPLLYLFIALVGSMLTVVVSKILSPNRIMTFISKHVLVIFCIHMYFVKFFSKKIFLSDTIPDQILLFFLSFAVLGLTIIVSIFINPYIQKIIFKR